MAKGKRKRPAFVPPRLAEDGKKWCYSCGVEKSIESFWKNSAKKDGLQPYCIDCDKTIAQNRFQRSNKFSRYNITELEFNSMLKSQRNKCAICKRKETMTFKGKLKSLNIDHDHFTKSVRGLLCAKCNLGLGAFEDNISVLRSAIRYLKRANNGGLCS